MISYNDCSGLLLLVSGNLIYIEKTKKLKIFDLFDRDRIIDVEYPLEHRVWNVVDEC